MSKNSNSIKQELKIAIENIPPEGLDIVEELSSITMSEADDDILFGAVSIDLRANVVENSLIITGTIKTTATLICCRCLVQFHLPIQNSQVFYEKDFVHQDEVIDLTPDIREDIIVALPIKAVCNENCKGLCSQCGHDLNNEKCICSNDHQSTWHMQLDKIKKDVKREAEKKKNVKREA